MSNMVPVQASSAPYRLGRYRLIAQLGQGGMGMIHLAVAEGIGGFRKLFVVKELKQELTENDQFLGLFMREAKLAARLNHPNVVHTVEADQAGGRYFLAMEFLDGRPFNEILRRAEQAPAVPLAVRLQIICHALAGLHHAHELTDYDGKALQVVHRDVSPANIFVTYDGQVKMLDFGIAKANDVEGTKPGSFKGKVGYAAPEQLRMQPADRRTDVFAFGVVLWEAIALRHLVRGKPTRQVFESRLLGTEPRIGQLLDVDPQLAAICDRAMCKDPDQRYPSAAALGRDLQAFLAERELSVDPAAIGELMRSKFANERGALHRLIEAQLNSEADPDSIVMRRLGPASSRSEGLAEVSGVRDQREVGSLSWARRLPESLKRKYSPRLLGTLALMALAGATVWRLRGDTENEKAEREGKQTQVAPSSGERTLPMLGRSGPSLAKASADAGLGAASPRPAPQKAGRGEASAAPTSPGETARARKTARPGEGSSGSAALSESPRAGVIEAGTGPSAVPKASVPAALDVDLRNIQRPARRSLDVDNPFR